MKSGNSNLCIPAWSTQMFLLAVFLFSGLCLIQLGQYSLWDDESYTALSGKGIIRTADTSAVIDHNVVALHNGLVLRSLKDRSTAPLSAILAAVGMFFFGENSFGARIVFSILGIVFFALAYFGSVSIAKDHIFPLLFIIFLLGNTALILFFRQARYYSPGIFFISLIALLNAGSHLSRRNLWLSACVWLLLFLTNQLWALAAAVCLVADLCIWQRKALRSKVYDIIWPLVVVLCAVTLIACIWNPFLTSYGRHLSNNTLFERAQLVLWNFRDFNSSELGSLLFLTLGLVFGILTKDKIILRLLIVLLLFFTTIAAFSPQLVSSTNVADVRYLSPMIPFAAGVTARVITKVFLGQPMLIFSVSFLLSFTTLYQGAPFLTQLRSTPLLFIKEMLSPPNEPYGVATEWLRSKNIGSQSIFVIPGYMTYPLMFHYPKAIYAWQLLPQQKNDSQFKNLPDIHFKGLVPPDFIVVFGPSVEQIRQLMAQWSLQGLRYQEVTRLMTFWKDLYRPELFWRTFKPIENFDPNTEAIYIFQRQS